MTSSAPNAADDSPPLVAKLASVAVLLGCVLLMSASGRVGSSDVGQFPDLLLVRIAERSSAALAVALLLATFGCILTALLLRELLHSNRYRNARRGGI